MNVMFSREIKTLQVNFCVALCLCKPFRYSKNLKKKKEICIVKLDLRISSNQPLVSFDNLLLIDYFTHNGCNMVSKVEFPISSYT